MAHHSSDEADKIMQKIVKDMDLGATGKFPEGKLTDSDEGEIKVAIGSKDGKVVINFGTQVVWVGLNPEQAHNLAQSLLEKANEIRFQEIVSKK